MLLLTFFVWDSTYIILVVIPVELNTLWIPVELTIAEKDAIAAANNKGKSKLKKKCKGKSKVKKNVENKTSSSKEKSNE